MAKQCKGCAKRQGNAWVPVGNLDASSPPIWQDLALWRDTLYGAGAININGTPYKDLVYLDGNEWKPVSTGILGGFGAGRSLAVFQDQLYVSGSIPIAAGNAGHGIMRWDGTAFHPVGTGFQGDGNNYQYLVGASDAEVHNGRLWAAGTFKYAGNVPAPFVASWDGQQWCGLPAGPNLYVTSLAFYHDTLFIAPRCW